ncbi:MAG: bifunctional phosphopantothenoylcysteine decarboxylase/phosphopantothenate--cysteine ligase CoaBC [Micrococcales bacterium]
MLRVILGITGGISAYKATSIIRLLTEAGHQVKVVPTANALRFIGATTLEALSHNTVDPDLYTDVDSVKHVELGQQTDLVIIAPATASFLARSAAGLADDLLGNIVLATKAPIFVAPAMHTEMWQNPATQANVELLRSRGVFVMEPDSGRLTGSDSGPGRLPEPEAIVASALATHYARVSGQGVLLGKRVLVTAGGTQEPIDPVRFLGNRSSGKMGLAIARAAQAQGAQVTLVGANLSSLPSGFTKVVSVQSAQELAAVVHENLASVDLLIMAAAVADFRVENPSEQKIKRGETNGTLELRLVANPDILVSSVGRIRERGLRCFTVGFAAETAGNQARLAGLAATKLESKGCDVMIANDVSDGAVFGSDDTAIFMLDKAGGSAHFTGSKIQAGAEVVRFISQRL